MLGFDFFKEENVHLLFEEKSHGDEFIACVDYSKFGTYSREFLNFDWIINNFQGGRWGMIILQRHSVYAEGKEIFVNPNYEEVKRINKLTGNIKKVIYDLVLDKPIKKKEPCTHWTYGLDVCFHSLEEAKSEAIRYSNSGYKVAIMEFVESHDMFAW
ncbi:MAG: hypothetical protein IK005_08730 [Paludibacteraceae bacterium]|nr:hypothetical protein [Paludibacteraceae bacterium]MBR4840548.1 hypothetical protein [Paludibacteraceae bacterium]